jgi:protein O-GlcNAc transferase
LLNQLLSQGAGSPRAWRSVIELNLNAGRNTGLAVAKAKQKYPDDPDILSHCVLVHLQNRQPASARRTAFRERIQYSIGRSAHSIKQSETNLLASIELTGRTDLLPFFHPTIQTRLTDSPALLANLVMQLASQCSPRYGEYAEILSGALPKRDKASSKPHTKRLAVGFVSPDLFYHPVGRFLQMLLKAGFGKGGHIHLINTGSEHLPSLQMLCNSDHYHHLHASPREQQLDQIRHLNLDIAVDLAGWTGSNNGWLFAKGIAPIQVNYLGYFASNGLSAMDVWLGDHQLFPEPMQEWHSERIVRLARPFLAWAPNPDLPEGRVDVPPAPSGPITFGSFNNSRKLSGATLNLWGRILHAIPGSRLTLKAYGSDDPGLTQLIEQRMLKCGLDPARVQWLPTCPSAEDHLRQYGLIDIALDPFPNGGCTTTCEAIWMGVPVITLCGTHYVSRMSTTVLRGANLGEWVAESEEQYFELALKAEAELAAIRSNRSALREHVRRSPLGDVDDLADQLWQCFEDLAAAKLKAAA